MLGCLFSPVTWAKFSPIYDVEVQDNGALLLGTTKGIQRLDDTTQSIQKNLFKLGMTERLVRVVKRINGQTLLGTNNGLYVYQEANLTKHLSGLIIYDVVTRNQEAMVATSQGVVAINLITGTTVWLQKNIKATKLAVVNNQLLIGTTTGLYLEKNGLVIPNPDLENTYIRDIVMNNNDLIILSNPYTYRLTSNGQLQRLDSDNDPAFHHGIIDGDRQVIWLASQDGILHVRTLDTFTPINHTLNREPQKIKTLAIDSLGNVFVGTKKGLEQYSPPIIRTLPQTQDTNYIVGTEGNEFSCTDNSIKRNGQLIAEDSSLLQGNRIMDCHVQNGALYLATYKGLLSFDDRKNQLEKINLLLSHTSILSLSQGTQPDSLFLGTLRDGLVEITEHGEKICMTNSGQNAKFAG